MRKLTVKNFSVIKDAESTPLEFGKITVLIGPQASGKSLLCKLAYFFENTVIEQARAAIRQSEPFDRFRDRVGIEFARRFHALDALNVGTTKVSYSDGGYSLSIAYTKDTDYSGGVSADFHPAFIANYESVRSAFTPGHGAVEGLRDTRLSQQAVEDALNILRPADAPKIYSFIPSTRSFLVTTQKAVIAAANMDDEFITQFSQDFDFAFERRVEQRVRQHALDKWIDEESVRLLHGVIEMQGNSPSFRSKDSLSLPLSILSSGTQELLPLITCLREFVAGRVNSFFMQGDVGANRKDGYRLFYVEEPEANVFPSTQYNLVRIFARMTNEPILDTSWVITTHSPYILSAFNNLIEAGQVAKEKPELKGEVAKIIPEQYWIKEGDFKAYAIEDGVLKSIVAEDTGLVSANYLDQVSETIGTEFDELLRLGYVEA